MKFLTFNYILVSPRSIIYNIHTFTIIHTLSTKLSLQGKRTEILGKSLYFCCNDKENENKFKQILNTLVRVRVVESLHHLHQFFRLCTKDCSLYRTFQQIALNTTLKTVMFRALFLISQGTAHKTRK